MAISIDWPSAVITINQTDPEVSLVSGTTYELDTNAFRLAIKALEDDPEGMPWPKVTRHNTVITIDGIQYVRSWEILPPYTVVCLPDTGWRLRMDGQSNNNIHSEGILTLNSVQVIPQNSAGNTVTQTGVSGLTAQESADLATTKAEAELARKLMDADRVLSDGDSGNMLWIDADDGVTVLRTKNVKDKDGNPIDIPEGAPAEERRQ